MGETNNSVEEALASIVSKEGEPSAALLELLALHHIKHNGKVGGHGGIVEATSNAWQVRDVESRRLLKRDEINWRAGDARYSKRLKIESFALLRDMSFSGHTFVPPPRDYDIVLCFGNHLRGILSMRHLLVQQWRAGLRTKKIVLLGAPRQVHVAEIEKLREAFLKTPDAVRTQDTLVGRSTFGLGSYTSGIGMWLWWWNHLPLPPHMREYVQDLDLVTAPETMGPDGNLHSATTRDALFAWYNSEGFLEADQAYLVVSGEPITLRQYLLTKKFLRGQGKRDVNIDVLGGPEPIKRKSITLYLRELSSLLYELLSEYRGR